MDLMIGVGIFIAIILVMEGVFLLARTRWNPEVQRIKQKLKGLSEEEPGQGSVNLLKKKELSDIPWLNDFLKNLNLPAMWRFDRVLEEAKSPYPLGVYILLAILLGVAGFLVTSYFSKTILIAIPVALLLTTVPFAYAFVRRRKRLDEFEKQLPDALEMIARTLRAGHAFPTGLQMVAHEFGEPLKSEFKKTLDEINFGISYEEALRNLASRMDCQDVKFFVVSVIIQKNSGGNLAEILENIGRLIRERFKLKGRIRTLSAEARLSAGVLIILPFAIFITLSFVNPSYVNVLITDPLGQMVVAAALFLMLLGIIFMRRMIIIRV